MWFPKPFGLNFKTTFLSSDKNAIKILQNNLDKVDWSNLSSNKNAIELIKNNLDKVDWCNFSRNPSIFQDESIPTIIIK